jgi:GR25 family glycosyltransferase involved in LPS biosynthesis
MRSFVITIRGHSYSEESANRCIDSALTYNIHVEKFDAVTKDTVDEQLIKYDLKWSWANQNTENTVCPITGLEQFPYTSGDLRNKIACSMSHYLLWKLCVEIDEPILILEHDAVFIRELPDIEFNGAIQINDPKYGGYRGKHHSQQMTDRGIFGVHPLTRKRPEDSKTPDGFSGNSAYIVKPWAAEKFIDAFHHYGIWPNDATICLQLFSWLEEYYPFITTIRQTYSTSTE